MLALVVVMGVLIVAGVVTLAVTIMHRLGGPAASAAVVMDEPAGTHIQSLSAVGDRLALLLQGGGPDRVILVDPRSGLVVGRVGLTR
jgi:hypothetical protein